MRAENRMRNTMLMVVVAIAGVLSACGGGGNSSPSVNLDVPQNFNVDANSSHTLQNTDLYVSRLGIRTTNFGTFATAVSYADFDLDGDIDVFMSAGDGSQNTTPAELYLNDGANNFTLDTSLFNGASPGLVHPRKALTGDFNGDGKMDVFVIGHGYDQPPFPGEAPYVMLSTSNGFVMGTGLESLIGFHHGGASADIDADGDLDIFLTDQSTPYFLINDGLGNFTKDTSRLSGLSRSSFFTAELVDVDKDGYVDLLAGGHEHEGFPTRILWGDSTGSYSTGKSTTLPSVGGYGTMVDADFADIDLDGDKDVVLNRTSGGQGSTGFYQGYYVQVIENIGNRQFLDKTSERITSGNDAASQWFDWIRVQDINNDGNVDIVVDDASRNLIWYNDGMGNFQLNL
jgi:hypothetical protein